MTPTTEQPTLTRGQREDVTAIKQIFADVFDEIERQVEKKLQSRFLNLSDESDIKRLADEAKSNLETAQMYAVKAVTR